MARLSFNPELTYPSSDSETARIDPPFKLGDRAIDSAGKEWIFVSISFRVDAYHACVIDEDAVALHTLASRGARGDRVGIPIIHINTDDYGWLQIYGDTQVQVGANCDDHVNLYTTSDGGQLDDSSAGQEQIHNLFLTSSRGSSDGLAPCILNFPSF